MLSCGNMRESKIVPEHAGKCGPQNPPCVRKAYHRPYRARKLGLGVNFVGSGDRMTPPPLAELLELRWRPFCGDTPRFVPPAAN